MKWLLLTVGGSHQPVVKSIETLKPERVVFICTGDRGGRKGSWEQVKGTGDVCGGFGQPANLPNIPTQTGLNPDQYKLSIYDADADDLSQCYEKTVRVIRQIRQMDEHAGLWCDYTGGTKSMSAALAMAALDEGEIRIMLVTGNRPDLMKVEDGTEFLTPARTEAITLLRLQRGINALMRLCEYSAAEQMIRTYLLEGQNPTARNWLLICRGFDAWDRFQHKEAHQYLSDVTSKELKRHVDFLRLLTRAENPAWKTTIGYLQVADILANAARRAQQGRYDDAVARHYRAVELLVQTYLWTKHQIDTSAVMAEQVPDGVEWKKTVTDWPFLPGLIKSWDIAAELDESLRSFWREQKKHVLAATATRNYSILAHGTEPIGRQGYEFDRDGGMGGFAASAWERLKESDRSLSGLPEAPSFLNSVDLD